MCVCARVCPRTGCGRTRHASALTASAGPTGYRRRRCLTGRSKHSHAGFRGRVRCRVRRRRREFRTRGWRGFRVPPRTAACSGARTAHPRRFPRSTPGARAQCPCRCFARSRMLPQPAASFTSAAAGAASHTPAASASRLASECACPDAAEAAAAYPRAAVAGRRVPKQPNRLARRMPCCTVRPAVTVLTSPKMPPPHVAPL